MIFSFIQFQNKNLTNHPLKNVDFACLVGADYIYSAIPCRIVDFPNIIQNQKIFLSIGNPL